MSPTALADATRIGLKAADEQGIVKPGGSRQRAQTPSDIHSIMLFARRVRQPSGTP
jgi:hypothetical protein